MHGFALFSAGQTGWTLAHRPEFVVLTSPPFAEELRKKRRNLEAACYEPEGTAPYTQNSAESVFVPQIVRGESRTSPQYEDGANDDHCSRGGKQPFQDVLKIVSRLVNPRSVIVGGNGSNLGRYETFAR